MVKLKELRVYTHVHVYEFYMYLT